MTYENPILRGSHPDPSICRVNDVYYLANSSFEYLPGLPVYKSKDLINWKLLSFGINDYNVKDFPFNKIKSSMGVLAPTIRYYNGVFYIICTFAGKGTFIIKSENAKDKWSKPIWLKNISGYDPSITFINNTCYLQMSTDTEIYQCELDPDKGEILSKKKVITKGSGGRDPEGPHIYYRFGKYWLLLAEGGTREGHMVTILTADNIYGPYNPVNNNPILTNRDYKGKLQCVGHADLVETVDGKFELVALAVRQPKHIHLNLLGRETILLPVEWDKDGIKVNRKNIEGVATVKIDEPIMKRKQEINNGITKENIISVFNIPRYKFQNKSLLCNPASKQLNDNGFLGIRQSEFNGYFSFDIKPKLHKKLGLIVYKDNNHFFRVVYNLDNEVVECEKRSGDLAACKSIKLMQDNNSIKFNLNFDKKMYEISVKNSDKEVKDTFETRHLTCEGSDSPFTGVIIGMFFGNNKGIFNHVTLKYN